MVGGGLDKLSLRIATEIRPTPAFYALYESKLRNRGQSDRYYSEVHDLRGYDLPVRLHAYSKFDIHRHTKLEFVGVSSLTGADLTHVVRRMYDTDPRLLQLMHLDMYADISDVHVEWFRKHATVKHKRSGRNIGTRFDWKVSSSGLTLHFGTAPNGYRIYDKLGELRKRFDSETRRTGEISALAAWFGRDPPKVLTRVERQMNGRKIPQRFSTLGGLLASAVDFDPFENLVLRPGGIAEPSAEDYAVMTFLAGTGLRLLIETRGLAEVKTLLNQRSTGNASRILRKLKDFIPHEGESTDVPNLTKIFQDGIRKQFEDEPLSTYAIRRVV